MRYTRRVAALALLFIAVLTWALVRSFGEERGYGKPTMEVLNRLALAENRLLKDTLLARSGLLLTYDPLVREIDEMRRCAAELAAKPSPWQADADAIKRIVDQKENALERFKSFNALLQNSLAYFDLVANATAASNEDAEYKNRMAGLAGAVMHLLRSPTEKDAKALMAQLDDLKRSSFSSQPDIALLHQHGKLLALAIPATNGSIRFLQETTTQSAAERVLAAIEQQRLQHHQQRIFKDGVLYVTSLIIFLLLMRTLALLKHDSSALQWTVLRERLAFEASRLFIACPPELVEQRIVEMMRMLAEGYESDRVYVLRLDGSKRISSWSRKDAATDDWPRTLFGFVPELLALPQEAFRIPYDDVDVSPALGQSFVDAGVKIWSCVKVRLEDEVVALLCFDRTTNVPVGIRSSHDNLNLLANVLHNTFLRQKLYGKRRELEIKLRRAERLEAIGTFTSGVAHNFNNLIGAIAAQAEMAVDLLPAQNQAVPHVRQVLRTTTRAKEVANQILDFGRIGTGDVQVVAVVPVIEETVAYIAGTTGDRVTIEVVGRDVDASTRADPGRLQQVFHNVIINAIQASPETASIEVSLDRMTTDERTLPLGQLNAGRYLCVKVKDRGQGIEPQTFKRIFEPFFTTRPTGTGLGLATVLETVNELEGGVEIESEAGIGTTVTIWLPEATHRPRVEPRLDPVGKTVLVVNSDRDSVLRDEELLATLGFEPVGFTDAPKALEAISSGNGRFDVLIVDEHISGMSLRDFVDRARESFGGGKRIISTGSYIRIDAADFERLEVSAHISRPWSPRSLCAKISIALEA